MNCNWHNYFKRLLTFEDLSDDRFLSLEETDMIIKETNNQKLL